MKKVTSPLRYPGSKVRITEMVAGLLEQNLLVGSHLYEPFAGGSAVSLALLANGFVPSATWVERDPLRAWQRMLPLRDVQRPTKLNFADLGYAGLFFNRTCFSGIVGAGPIGGMTQNSPYKIDCRFNKKELASAIRDCSKTIKKVDIIFGDGIKFLKQERLQMPSHSVVYIDPPYVTNGHKLYRHYFDEKQHEQLADAVGNLRAPWLMSYDNHEQIKRLYVGEQAKFVKTYQSLKGSRFVKEILLLSEEFKLPKNETFASTSKNRGSAYLSNYEH